MPPRRTTATPAATGRVLPTTADQLIRTIETTTRSSVQETGIDLMIGPSLPSHLRAAHTVAMAAMRQLRDQHYPGTKLDFEMATDSSGALVRITRAVEAAERRNRFR